MKKETPPQKSLDAQLAEWRKKFSKEIPEKGGFAFYTNEKGETEVEVYFADDNMGLTSWKYAPEGKILRTDVTVAKNYLAETELKRLSLALSAFLDMAEMRATQHLPTTMQQWIEFMNGYLKLNNLPVLKGFGKISKERADEKAIVEYGEFRIIQDRNYIGDFEKLVKCLK